MIRLLRLACSVLALLAYAYAHAEAKLITVVTDTQVVDISLTDGAILGLELAQHAAGKNGRVALFGNEGKATIGLTGTGVEEPGRYVSARDYYDLPSGADSLEVRIVGTGTGDVQIAKSYTFHRGSYLIEVAQEITNTSGRVLHAKAVFELSDTPTAPSLGATVYSGPAYYSTASQYRKMGFEEIAKGKGAEPVKADNGWVAMVRHYFVSAWIPEASGDREYFTRQISQNVYGAGVRIPVVELAPGDIRRIGVRLYAGPQEQNTMAAIAPGFEEILDYGWLAILSIPLLWLLKAFHAVAGNWGWSIVLLTVLVKGVLYPLSVGSYRSMARMRALAPQVEAIKTACGSNKKQLGEKIMDLYEKEGANPLGGFVPLLVQIPVFIALFSVLMGTVEMRGAPWILWIADLSANDPYYVLPLLMGATLLVQASLNPKPTERYQVALTWGLPVLFTIAFLFMPAGLVLYWTVNNLLSVLQQWQITRTVVMPTQVVAAGQ